uniref:L-aminoadipate-semialdehyde dehydrogenase-phosphopantetheinyl transferase n=1 Tax=Meloidogyne incognita TaxID=6306 RepID=A0A914M3X9_MELIC
MKASSESFVEKCFCNRWAFSLKRAMEDENFEHNFRLAIQSVPKEDYEKSMCFRFRDDQIATLVSRLFLRQASKRFTGAKWEEIEFNRTQKGKPYLVTPSGYNFGLNTSHQGDLTVFASSCTSEVGVDVMRLDMSRGDKTADEYINSMAKSASANELKNMRCQPTEQMKMTIFYRYWCLKEAVLKATGQGIVDDLSRYDFRIDTNDRYKQGNFLTSTTLLVDNEFQPKWVFEESFVDVNHVAATCRTKNLPKSCTLYCDSDANKMFFSKVNFDFLLDGSSILNPLPGNGIDAYNNFLQKPKKN